MARVAITDAAGNVLNVIMADPQDLDLLNGITAQTVILGEAWVELPDDSPVGKEHVLTETGFRSKDELLAEVVEAKVVEVTAELTARKDIVEAMLTKDQLAQVEAQVAELDALGPVGGVGEIKLRPAVPSDPPLEG